MALSFEQQQPKPVAHRLVRSAQTIKVIKLSSDEEVSFSLEDETILQAFLSGHSIQEVILTLRQQNTRLSFSKIIEVLDQLYLNGLLQNGEEFAYHLDSLRWHYSWPESWLKSDFLKYGILPGVKDRSPLGGLLGLIGGILVIILLWSFSGHIYARANPGIFIINGAYWHFLLSLFVVSSSYFSLKTLLRGGLLYLANGRFPTLTVRLNGIGLYVDGYSSEDSDGLVYQINSLLSLAVGSLSIFILPLFLKVVQMPESLQTDFSAVIFFWLLMESSPFCRSDLTRGLMAFYNLTWGSRKESGQNEVDTHGTLRETLVYVAHIGFIVIWLVALVLFAVWLLPQLTTSLEMVLEQSQVYGQTSALIFLSWWISALGSLIFEVGQAFEYVGPQKSYRRYWHLRRAKPCRANELQKGLTNVQEIIRKIPLFSRLDENALITAAKNSRIEHYRQGDFICQQGAADRDMFFLLSGEVAVYRRYTWRRSIKVADFGSGSLFGEVSFFTGGKRTADVVAVNSVVVLRIQYISREMMGLSEIQFRFIQDRIWLLQTLVSSPIFADLPIDVLEVFLNRGRVADVSAGKKIISEGEMGNMFYVLIQGRCEVTQGKAHLRTLQRGEVFGEVAILLNTFRTASVTSLEECKVLEIAASEFWQVLGCHVSLAIFMERLAYSRLRNEGAEGGGGAINVSKRNKSVSKG